MGTWRLESIIGDATRRAGNICGHDVFVTFQMRYTPGFFGRFKETPELEWYERITVLDHHKPEYWTTYCNQYFRNPTSSTMEPWARRYVDAYRRATGEVLKEHERALRTTLLDVRGVPVNSDVLPPGLKDSVSRRDAVREYLRLRGGILEITIHDIPTINAPEGDASGICRERLLEFDVGVVGNGKYRWRGAQYLLFDNRTGSIQQTVEFRTSMRPLDLRDYKKGKGNPLAMKFNPRVFLGKDAAGYVL